MQLEEGVPLSLGGKERARLVVLSRHPNQGYLLKLDLDQYLASRDKLTEKNTPEGLTANGGFVWLTSSGGLNCYRPAPVHVLPLRMTSAYETWLTQSCLGSGTSRTRLWRKNIFESKFRIKVYLSNRDTAPPGW